MSNPNNLLNKALNNVSSGQMFIISAPSGAGKTSLVRALLEKQQTTGVAVSHTTRRHRPGEVDGINYHFIDEARFREMIDAGAFLEWASVFGNLYGTSIDAAKKVLTQGQHLILEIDWQGAQQVRQKMPAAASVFILPPSLKTLRERLEARAQDDAATVRQRTAAAIEEISHFREFDYLVVNDDFETALDELTEIVEGRGQPYRRDSRQPDLQGLIEDLLSENLT